MQIDSIINSFMNSIEFSSLTAFSKFVSSLTEPLILLVVAFIVGVFVYFKKYKKEGLLFSLTILTTGVLIKLLKEVFQRARPLDSLILETGYSLPSGHATMAVVFFGLISYLFISKKYLLIKGSLITLVILFIGFARIYLRVHWLTDIIVGYIIGIMILILAIIIHKKLKQS